MQKLFFRADADSVIGFGHFVRTLALAEMLKDDFDCTFYTAEPTENQKSEVTKICRLIELPADERKFKVFLNYLSGGEIVFLDNYFFTPEYERTIKEKGCKLVVLAPSKPHHYADIVINFVDNDLSNYSVESYTKIVAGLEWSILRKPFREPVNDHSKHKTGIVISFGGTDQYCLTEKVVDALDVNYRVSVIMTSRVSQERRMLLKRKGVNVYTDITADEVAFLFEQNEYAILSSSTVCLEALSRHSKVFAGYYVSNQVHFYNVLMSKGCICGLGDLLLNESFARINYQLGEYTKKNLINMDFSMQKENYLSLFSSLC